MFLKRQKTKLKFSLLYQNNVIIRRRYRDIQRSAFEKNLTWCEIQNFKHQFFSSKLGTEQIVEIELCDSGEVMFAHAWRGAK